MNFKTITFAAAIFTLAGCATSEQTYLPDGRVGYNLNCSGTLRDWGECLTKAGEICGSQGYDVISQQGEEGRMVGANASTMNAGLYGSSLHFRTMQIACKP